MATAEDVLHMQQGLDEILCAPPVLDYVVSIVEATRSLGEVLLGVSPRGSIALMQAAKGDVPCLRAGGTSCPTTCSGWQPPCCATGWCCAPGRGMQRQTPETVLDAVLRRPGPFGEMPARGRVLSVFFALLLLAGARHRHP